MSALCSKSGLCSSCILPRCSVIPEKIHLFDTRKCQFKATVQLTWDGSSWCVKTLEQHTNHADHKHKAEQTHSDIGGLLREVEVQTSPFIPNETTALSRVCKAKQFATKPWFTAVFKFSRKAWEYGLRANQSSLTRSLKALLEMITGYWDFTLSTILLQLLSWKKASFVFTKTRAWKKPMLMTSIGKGSPVLLSKLFARRRL